MVKSKIKVRKISLADVPKGDPGKYSRRKGQWAMKAAIKDFKMVRKSGESLKSFHVRTLKRFYRERCKETMKSCWSDNIEELEWKLGDRDIQSYDLSKGGIVCRACPSPEASDDTWLRWGEYMGFRFDISKTKKIATITIEKPKPIPVTEPIPTPKKTVKPKVKSKPKAKPVVKKVMKRAPVKPKPTVKKTPAKKVKSTIKGTKLTAKQKKHLKDFGYFNITRNGKQHRITPCRVKKGIIQG